MNRVDLMLYTYSKVHFVRLDLHPQEKTSNNQLISNFVKEAGKYIEHTYKCKVEIIATREWGNNSNKEHYHLAVMLSGHKLKYPDNLLKYLIAAWDKHSGGTSYTPHNCYLNCTRGNRKDTELLIYRISYLSKAATKTQIPRGCSSLICFRPPKELQSLTSNIEHLFDPAFEGQCVRHKPDATFPNCSHLQANLREHFIPPSTNHHASSIRLLNASQASAMGPSSSENVYPLKAKSRWQPNFARGRRGTLPPNLSRTYRYKDQLLGETYPDG